ncbi:MAG: D-alanine--D-alanine ligase [Sorangiineae bacterium]|nr:D-alanine--D-alanine ligase [Polyangiaceae bacterium]MEB2324482.1 D-alanine--D-alanine ligase [Sorangiineae bacterium]
MNALRVAVVAGGPSSEAAVSRASAAGVERALEAAGHRPTRLELGPGAAAALTAGEFDVVFPVAHGPLGEDGCLQGLLEVLGLPYVGSGVLASALAASKPAAKAMFRRAGLPVAEEVLVRRGDDAARAAAGLRARLGRAVFIKPANGGSAIGVARVLAADDDAVAVAALAAAHAVDELALAEPLLVGAEVTCGVLEDERGAPRALPPTLIRSQAGDWYDFKSKYAAGGSLHECPAPLPLELFARVQELAVGAHRAVGARDLSRVDFVVGDDVTLLEINTLPGMTATSLFPEAAAAAGLPFPELCERLVRAALARPARFTPAEQAMP